MQRLCEQHAIASHLLHKLPAIEIERLQLFLDLPTRSSHSSSPYSSSQPTQQQRDETRHLVQLHVLEHVFMTGWVQVVSIDLPPILSTQPQQQVPLTKHPFFAAGTANGPIPVSILLRPSARPSSLPPNAHTRAVAPPAYLTLLSKSGCGVIACEHVAHHVFG